MVDIIIVTYNAEDKLKRCLLSIEKQTRKTPYLLTIINNNGRDISCEYLKRATLRNIRVINTEENLGFCGGANLGLSKTSNRFIALVDDDVELPAGWLEKLLSHIRRRRNVGIVGGKIVLPDNKIHSADCRTSPISLVGRSEIDRGQRDYIKEADALIGPCWLIRRTLVDKIGGFDERFFPCQHEDLDYCMRARIAGYKIIYDGTIKITHHNLLRDGGGNQFAKNWRKFKRKWKKQLKEFPLKDSHPVDIHIASSAVFLKKNMFVKAENELRKAADSADFFYEPLLMGIVCAGSGKYNEAIKHYKKAAWAAPDTWAPYDGLADVYRKMGLRKKSREYSLKALKHIDTMNKKFEQIRLLKKGKDEG